MQELTILMPCLNEEKTIEACIFKAFSFLRENHISGEVLVADNGSEDDSVEKAKRAGARVVTCSEKGYGNALLTGIRAAKGKYVIMGDSDDSYDFADLSALWDKLNEGFDLVVGNRFLGGIEKGAMPFWHRYLGNPVLSLAGRILYPCKVGDFHCGLRGFHREKICELSFQATGMEFASEMILKCRQAGYAISEVPVKLYKDGREGKSHLRSLRDGLRHMQVLICNRPLFSYVLTFALTALLCFGLLTTVNLIPRSMVEKQIRESAEFFREKPLFENLIEEKNCTMVDNYADCILTNIIYCMDSHNPFLGTVKASYYGKEHVEVNENLYLAVSNHYVGNIDYSRYWHGSMVVLRPLLCVFSIVGVRGVLTVLLVLLLVGVCAMLIKSGHPAPAIILAVSMLMVQAWVSAFCIEYITTFLVMLSVLLCVIRKERQKQITEGEYLRLFVVSGVITCFVDFLTTETITITMPLLFLFLLKQEKGMMRALKEELLFGIKSMLAWGMAYAFMFLAKWGISALVLGSEAFLEAFSEAGYRIGGTVTSNNTNLGRVLGLGEQLSATLWKNLQHLFALPTATSPGLIYLIAIGVSGVLFAIWYLFRKNEHLGALPGLLVIIGLVPYVRFLTLRNHSYIHCFFTYRAQIVWVAAVVSLLWYSIAGDRKDRSRKRERKRDPNIVKDCKSTEAAGLMKKRKRGNGF